MGISVTVSVTVSVGVSVTNALRSVRERVIAATRSRERGAQEPEMLDRLTRDVVLVAAAGAADPSGAGIGVVVP